MAGFTFGNVGFMGSLGGVTVQAPFVPYVSPYATANLFQYHDVNFRSSGVVLNGSNQVTQWNNQVAGGIGLTPPATAPTYLANVDGYPALNMAAGGLEAVQSLSRNQPLSATVLIKIVVNPGSISYNGIFAAADMTLIQKFTTGLLIQSIGVNTSGPDMPLNTWTPITMVWNKGASFVMVGATNAAFAVNDSSFSKVGLSGEILHRLLLCYNRALTTTEVTTLHGQIRAAYNLP